MPMTSAFFRGGGGTDVLRRELWRLGMGGMYQREPFGFQEGRQRV